MLIPGMPSSSSDSFSVSPATWSWANRPTTAFPPSTDDVAILPIYGLGDLGLGLSLDVEEVLGASILTTACQTTPPNPAVTVLPPLRFGLSPYQNAMGRVDPDTLHKTLKEIAQGVTRAGYKKLLFWSTSPWNSELVDTASRDIHIEQKIQTFIIELGGIGLSLHPASSDRAKTQALAAHLSDCAPDPTNDGQPRDASFRPGNWTDLPTIEFDTDSSASELFDKSAELLAELISEVSQRAPVDAGEAVRIRPHSSSPPECYPTHHRDRYLPALSRKKLLQLERKADSIVIIPVAAIEQHGAHLPVGVDSMIAEAACHGLAERLASDLWFCPPLYYGKSNEHEDFPGTISLSAQSLRQLIIALVRNLHAHGFRQFALLNTHGGNSSVLTYTIRELQQELNVRAGMLRLKATEELSAQEKTWGFHAGEWETSVMLAIAPERVEMKRAICHYPASLKDPGKLRPENAPVIFSWKTRDIAPEGVMGDATKGTAAKGERWLKAALDDVAIQIRELLQRP